MCGGGGTEKADGSGGVGRVAGTLGEEWFDVGNGPGEDLISNTPDCWRVFRL